VSDSAFSTAGYLLGLLVMYGVGYWHAVWRRARADFKETKSKVPVLRSGVWEAFGKLVRSGAIVVIVLALAILWLANEADHPRGTDQVPAKVPGTPTATAEPR
jgi:hypothetical protein